MRTANPRDDLDEQGVAELVAMHQRLTGHGVMMMRDAAQTLIAALCGACGRVIGETAEGRAATGGLDHDTIRWDIVRGLTPGLAKEADDGELGATRT